jgi:predicted transcriptional regulator
MSTTTIRLPDELKARITAAAERAGKTAHSFMLEAITEKTDREERRAEFNDVADTRMSRNVADGKTIPWSEMRRYLQDRVAGKSPSRPVAKKTDR